jgi:lambda repressor-like predicted transcriptional regulator
MSKTKSTTDPRDSIMQYIEETGRKLSWLSEQSGISYHRLYGCVKRKIIDLSQEDLDAINEVLNTDFAL